MRRTAQAAILSASLAVALGSSCGVSPGQNTDPDAGSTAEGGPISGKFDVTPGTHPKGVGLDFETGVSSDLTTAATDWKYDIRMQTIKGKKDDGTSSGAPHIKLFKQLAQGFQYGQTGSAALLALKASDIDATKLASDLVEEIDLSQVKTGADNDYEKLVAYYDANLVTKSSANWLPSPWAVGTDERIVIVKTEEGNFFALAILGMGPSDTGSGSKPGSGTVELSYRRLE
jgi:hypothetical protein